MLCAVHVCSAKLRSSRHNCVRSATLCTVLHAAADAKTCVQGIDEINAGLSQIATKTPQARFCVQLVADLSVCNYK